MLFFDADKFISDVLERLINCLELRCVYSIGNLNHLRNIHKTIRIEEIKEILDANKDGVIYISDNIQVEWKRVKECVAGGQIFCICTNEKSTIPSDIAGIMYDLSNIDGDKLFFLAGKIFEYHPIRNSEDFKVLAIMHFYNEADILEHTVRYLLDQKLDVYLLDNSSTDDSFIIAKKLKEEFPKRVYLEQYRTDIINTNGEKQHVFRLYEQMERSEQISKELDYDWFVHYDADEIRVSPWNDVCLRDAIGYVDSLGFDCMENTFIDFRLTDINEELFDNNGYFEIRYDVQDTMRKTWKKNNMVDLKQTGGHVASFKQPNIFPLRQVTKHYPFRNIGQASRKVFSERKKDFAIEKKKRNWHGHYDKFLSVDDFIYDKGRLLYWDEGAYGKFYLPLITCSGIKDDMNKVLCTLPTVREKKIAVYGAGKWGKWAIEKLSSDNKIVAWFDQKYEYFPMMYGLKVISPDRMRDDEFDFIIIAVKDVDLQLDIKNYCEKKGVDDNKILLMG